MNSNKLLFIASTVLFAVAAILLFSHGDSRTIDLFTAFGLATLAAGHI